MKHGKKSEKKAAKTVKKASSTKSSGKKAVASKSREKAGKKQTAKASGTEAARKSAAGPRPASTGRGKAPVQLTFTNAAVAAGFKRAVKKYPNAFRRLSD